MISGTQPRLLLVLAFFILVTCGSAAAQHGDVGPAPAPREYSQAPVSETEAWREDLRILVQELERLHPDPYHRTPEARFDSSVAALDAAIPRLAAHEIIVEFTRLLALVGDGHTSLPLYFARGVDFHVLPYRLGIYEDGVYVEAADREYRRIVGGRLLAIGDVPIDVVMARVTPLISRDNDNWIAAVAPNLLNRIEALHALGIAEDLGGVTLTSEVGGDAVSERVEALTERPSPVFGLPFQPQLTDDWMDARDAADAPVPLYQRRFEDKYWWEFLPDEDLLYIKLDQVQNRADGPTALEVFRDAMAAAREHRPARTVVDIRNNTGGEGGLLPPIIREIVRTREIDEPGKLFLVIGRRTFSAGQMMTGFLERFSSAILVGEPSSAFYNGYAGHAFVHLPNSGIGFMVSPDYYQMGSFPRDARRQATPRLAAIPTFAGYRANRDRALDVILNYEPDALAHGVLAALARGDTARAAELVLTFDALPVNHFVRAASELNGLGYSLLNEGRTEQALAMFELNVRLHPEYANGWDSLGEAYVRAGRRKEAVAAFRRALAINPELEPSRAWLRRLGAESL